MYIRLVRTKLYGRCQAPSQRRPLERHKGMPKHGGLNRSPDRHLMKHLHAWCAAVGQGRVTTSDTTEATASSGKPIRITIRRKLRGRNPYQVSRGLPVGIMCYHLLNRSILRARMRSVPMTRGDMGKVAQPEAVVVTRLSSKGGDTVIMSNSHAAGGRGGRGYGRYGGGPY